MWYPQSEPEPNRWRWLVPWVYPGLVIVGLLVTVGWAVRPSDHTVSGVLVNREGQWEVLTDAGHASVGITAVETTDEAIIVRYSGGVVLSFDVDADDALVRADVSVGASVGTDHAVLTLARNGVVLDPATVTEPGGAIFMSGTFR